MSLTAAPAAAQERTPPPWLNVQGGVTQPVVSFANAIEQTVFVESEVDSDGDGRKDRVRIRISRPGETATQGIKVPVIFDHSPTAAISAALPNHTTDHDYTIRPLPGTRLTLDPDGSKLTLPIVGGLRF